MINALKKTNTSKFAIPLVGVCLLAIIVVIVISIQWSDDRTVEDEIRKIDTRLNNLEERLKRIEGIEKRTSLLDQQRTKFEISLMNRLESLEALVTIRKKPDVEKPDNLHREAMVSKPASTGVKVEGHEREKRVQYHQVQAGETLYRISLKYHLSVDELRGLNNIGPESLIYVGQKLRVTKEIER